MLEARSLRVERTLGRGDQKAEDVLKGLELTGLWLNEASLLEKLVLDDGTVARLGELAYRCNLVTLGDDDTPPAGRRQRQP